MKAVLSGSGGSQKNCAAERRLDDAAAIIAARLSARGLREAACRRRRSRHGLRWLEGASAFATRVCMEASNQPWHYQAPRSSDPRCPPLPRFRFRLVGSRKIASGCGISHVMSCLIHLITWIYNLDPTGETGLRINRDKHVHGRPSTCNTPAKRSRCLSLLVLPCGLRAHLALALALAAASTGVCFACCV